MTFNDRCSFERCGDFRLKILEPILDFNIISLQQAQDFMFSENRAVKLTSVYVYFE